MSKPIKNLITSTYRDRFGDLDSALLIDVRGVASNDNNTLRNTLAKKEIHVTVIRNTLARAAFKDTNLEPISELIDGPTAMVYGGASVVEVAREMIAIVKTMKQVELKGAIMEGALFGPNEIERLSKFPTREEAQAQAVQIILTPAMNLAGAILGPGRKVASLVDAIKEKLEKGETIKA